MAIIFTWAYNRSAGSLIPVVLLHVMVNTTNMYMLHPTMSLSGMAPFLLFVGVICLAALTVILFAGSSLGKSSLAEPTSLYTKVVR